jgi:hypothetical protein
MVQDRDSKHTSYLIQNWYHDQDIALLPWASISPDMNCIENLWANLDERIHARDPAPRNLEELWVVTQEEWYGTPVEQVCDLYRSMPHRVQELYDANGQFTHY